MLNGVSFDYTNAKQFVSEEEISMMKRTIEDCKKIVLEGTGAGNDFLGWVNLPIDYDKEEFVRIQKAAEKIQSDSEVLVGHISSGSPCSGTISPVTDSAFSQAPREGASPHLRARLFFVCPIRMFTSCLQGAFINATGAGAQEEQEQRVCYQHLAHLVASVQEPEAVTAASAPASAPASGTESESLCGETNHALQGAIEKLQVSPGIGQEGWGRGRSLLRCDPIICTSERL